MIADIADWKRGRMPWSLIGAAVGSAEKNVKAAGGSSCGGAERVVGGGGGRGATRSIPQARDGRMFFADEGGLGSVGCVGGEGGRTASDRWIEQICVDGKGRSDYLMTKHTAEESRAIAIR